MRRRPGAFRLILASVLMTGAALPASAQTSKTAASPVVPSAPNPGRNVAPTGRTMPPPGGRAVDPAAKTTTKPAAAPTSASINAEMLKAQKASEARNKSWDTRMRKTMGSICSGC